MSFEGDKKREHSSLADLALREGDYRKAAFHMAKAAEFSLKLADKSDGKVQQGFVDEARDLVEIGEELQGKVKPRATQAAELPNGKVKPRATQAAELPNGKVVPQTTDDSDVALSQWRLKEKPTEKLDDVAGLEAVKTELREKVIEPFLHPEAYDKFKVRIGGGILMYGPPGNGKTFIAKAVAGELDAAFFNVNASQIKDKYVGETEKNIQKLFDEARQHPKAVLFFDEVDHLLAKRGNRKIGTVAQFLTQMDGLVKNTNCLLVLGATNKPWVIDEAVVRPGRMGTHIYVGPPDALARKGMLSFNLKGVPVAPDLAFEEIVALTDRYSGADMAELSDRAKRAALKRLLSGATDSVVTTQDFKDAVALVRPSVTPAMLKEFEVWRDGRSGAAGESDDDE